jgi:hypothetical protein
MITILTNRDDETAIVPEYVFTGFGGMRNPLKSHRI